MVEKSLKIKYVKETGPWSQPMVILEKESSAGASTHKLMLPEMLESTVAGNLDVRETTKGSVSFFSGSIGGPKR
jgi:hypothetical protein